MKIGKCLGRQRATRENTKICVLVLWELLVHRFLDSKIMGIFLNTVNNTLVWNDPICYFYGIYVNGVLATDAKRCIWISLVLHMIWVMS